MPRSQRSCTVLTRCLRSRPSRSSFQTTRTSPSRSALRHAASPGLSSRWLALVTDVDTQTGRSLVDSMANEVVVSDDSIRSIVGFEPMGYDEAVRTALREHDQLKPTG